MDEAATTDGTALSAAMTPKNPAITTSPAAPLAASAAISFTDTHCHIQEASIDFFHSDQIKKLYLKAGSPSPEELLRRARAAGVERLIVVGTTVEDSEIAVRFAGEHDNVWASIGIHPHAAETHRGQPDTLARFTKLAARPKVVAIGECGLDYYYEYSPKTAQLEILRFQIELALQHDLALIFHVRDAFNDFWPVFDDFSKHGAVTGAEPAGRRDSRDHDQRRLRGIIHSFSSGTADLQNILKRGLFVGLNGIMTFTKDPHQLDAAKAVPIDKLVLETDAPFLTPSPFRGTMCEPKHVRVTAEFLAELRGESLEDLAARTTANAKKVLRLK